MASNLTGSTIASTYSQLLHVDGGPEATEKIVYSGTGTPTAVKIGTVSFSVENIQLDGNTIRTLDANGNLTLAPNGTGHVGISNVSITGGSISGITDLAVADGGTGASDASGARTNLGLGTISTQDASSVSITGGSISGVSFSGTFTGITSITSLSFKATEDIGFTTGNGGTVTQLTSRTTGVTLNAPTGAITLVSGSLAGHASAEFTVTNSYVAATDVVIVNIKSGISTAQYTTQVTGVSAGSFKIALQNQSNSATPTEVPVLSFVVIKGAIS